MASHFKKKIYSKFLNLCYVCVLILKKKSFKIKIDFWKLYCVSNEVKNKLLDLKNQAALHLRRFR